MDEHSRQSESRLPPLHRLGRHADESPESGGLGSGGLDSDGPDSPQRGFRDRPAFARLKPAMVGRGLPVPPAVVTVGLICLIAGFAIGFGLPHQAVPPGPTPSSTATPAPTPAATDVPASPSEPGPLTSPEISPIDTPPPQGMSLTQVLDELERGALGLRTDVVDARIVRLGEISASADSPDQWVWALTLRGSYVNACGGTRFQPPEDPTNLPRPPGRSYSPCEASSELVVFDYATGAFVYAISPAPV